MTDAFVDNLQQHHDAVARFLELLEAEQAMLTDAPASIDALSQLTERKVAQANELEALDQRRRTLLEARGYTTDRSGAEQLAAACGCGDLWQALVERIEATRNQNRINGLVIGNRLDHTHRTLGFLQRATGQTLYGRNGRARSLGGKHSLSSGV
ncbi:flagella synthesis protein [Salinisphaera dokdonensis CL-ES53]|uniref:Flagella synthesis protein n=1 Tax=Salinisphaera dokdonensis CL-ES53 TaxID=1304272 RepID=A0ABV2AYB7_9GAMM